MTTACDCCHVTGVCDCLHVTTVYDCCRRLLTAVSESCLSRPSTTAACRALKYSDSFPLPIRLFRVQRPHATTDRVHISRGQQSIVAIVIPLLLNFTRTIF